MSMRQHTMRWLVLLFLGLAIIILGGLFAIVGLDEADKIASVIATFVGVITIGVPAYRWVTRPDNETPPARPGPGEMSLWPDALSVDEARSSSESEIVSVYPHRWMLPREAWPRLFSQAKEEIGILVYVGLFLAEDSGVQQVLAEKAKAGVRIRILLGAPESPHVRQRGVDEGIDDAIVAKVRNAFVLYRPLRQLENVEIRLHDTILYNSIFRADDQLFVNPHVYGNNASHAPLLHLQEKPDGSMVTTYIQSFDKVWETAKPLTGE